MTEGGGFPRSARDRVALAGVAFLLLFLVSCFFSSRVLGIRSQASLRTPDGGRSGSLLYEISRRPSFAFGFRNLLADVAWLEAVQVAGGRSLTTAEYGNLATLIATVVNFDPKFDVPYLLGGLTLGESPPHVPDALRILGRGRAELPADWRIPFYEGYIRYFSAGDPAGGGQAIEAAARIPGSPPYFPFLASRMLAEGRRTETALALLNAMVENESDPLRLRALHARIREVVAERDIQHLEEAVERYRRKTGRMPVALQELVTEGILTGLPREPNGGRYFLDPDGTVHSDRISLRLKVLRRDDGR